MRATITSKGQVTIPVELRRRLNLKTGDILDFDEQASILVARPQFDVDVMRKSLGCLAGRSEKNSTEFLNDVRGEVENPPMS